MQIDLFYWFFINIFYFILSPSLRSLPLLCSLHRTRWTSRTTRGPPCVPPSFLYPLRSPPCAHTEARTLTQRCSQRQLLQLHHQCLVRLLQLLLQLQTASTLPRPPHCPRPLTGLCPTPNTSRTATCARAACSTTELTRFSRCCKGLGYVVM